MRSDRHIVDNIAINDANLSNRHSRTNMYRQVVCSINTSIINKYSIFLLYEKYYNQHLKFVTQVYFIYTGIRHILWITYVNSARGRPEATLHLFTTWFCGIIGPMEVKYVTSH